MGTFLISFAASDAENGMRAQAAQLRGPVPVETRNVPISRKPRRGAVAVQLARGGQSLVPSPIPTRSPIPIPRVTPGTGIRLPTLRVPRGRKVDPVDSPLAVVGTRVT